jgi:hypothetical protein
MVATFESVRRDVVNGPAGSLSVASIPSHGRVYVDGAFRGVTPCTVDRLPVGTHLVVVRKTGYETWGGAAEVREERAGGQTRVRLRSLPGSRDWIRTVEKAAEDADGVKKLDAGLQRLAQEARLDRLLLGRLTKRGKGVAYFFSLFDVPSSRPVQWHQGVLHQNADDFAQAVAGVVTYLITGESGVLQSYPSMAVDYPPLRLQDEDQFEEVTTPIYKKWYFWTAIGVGVGAGVLLLALLLPESEEPKSQILLEF